MKTLKINGTEYTFQPTTGKVLSTNKNLETKVSGHGGGGGTFRGTGFTNSVKITSKTTVHDQIFIEDSNGTEHAYQLQDFDVSCREGNQLTILAAFKLNKNSGYNFAAINHTTRKTFYSEKNLQKIASPNIFLFLGIFVVTLFIFAKIFSGSALIIGLILFLSMLIYYIVRMKQNISMIKRSIVSTDYAI